MPKAMPRPQTPQNTTGRFTGHREKIFSSIHQNADTSAPNQDILTGHWSNPTHREQTPQLRGAMNFQPAERAPPTQKSKQNERAEKYTTG